VFQLSDIARCRIEKTEKPTPDTRTKYWKSSIFKNLFWQSTPRRIRS